jgi:hypothetical protein
VPERESEVALAEVTAALHAQRAQIRRLPARVGIGVGVGPGAGALVGRCFALGRRAEAGQRRGDHAGRRRLTAQ